MAASTGPSAFTSVTPLSLLVVAPAGYSLHATTPAAAASLMSSGVVLSVRYSVMRGSKSESGPKASVMRALYALASAAFTTGGTRFGMMMARRTMPGM